MAATGGNGIVVHVVADDVHVGAVVVDTDISIPGEIEALNVHKIAPVVPGDAGARGDDFRTPFDIGDESNACLCCPFGRTVNGLCIGPWQDMDRGSSLSDVRCLLDAGKRMSDGAIIGIIASRRDIIGPGDRDVHACLLMGH